jgi:predicted SprT family Zn-dependent metalloprotease
MSAPMAATKKVGIRCHIGVHRPRRRDRPGRGEFETTCRDCGCDLVLSPVTGRWRFVGVMG